jgi:hypothetical protein
VEGPDTAGRERDDDAIWREIVSRFDAGGQDEDGSWPAEENLDTRSASARVIKPASPEAVPDADALDHFVPPPPPPLPSLDPIAKTAWLCLFGGPAYLLVATVADWAIPGWVAFCAIAAFVGGFITLVVRMSDDRDSGPDDGAVI